MEFLSVWLVIGGRGRLAIKAKTVRYELSQTPLQLDLRCVNLAQTIAVNLQLVVQKIRADGKSLLLVVVASAVMSKAYGQPRQWVHSHGTIVFTELILIVVLIS